jgi:hypothetical protein
MIEKIKLLESEKQILPGCYLLKTDILKNSEEFSLLDWGDLSIAPSGNITSPSDFLKENLNSLKNSELKLVAVFLRRQDELRKNDTALFYYKIYKKND